MRPFFVIIGLLYGLAAFAAPAVAQTSFGAERHQKQAANRAEWMRATEAVLLVQLRRANSTLEMHGPSRAIQMMLTVAIARDGRVLDIAVIGSSGYPELDRSVERAMSRVTQVQPFSPDMANETVILSLGIGTKRG